MTRGLRIGVRFALQVGAMVCALVAQFPVQGDDRVRALAAAVVFLSVRGLLERDGAAR